MRAIVLISTQYSDNSFIVNLYTDESGMVVVSVRTGGHRSKFRRSYLMPLTILDVELTGRERSEIRYIGDCSLAYNPHTLGIEPIKILQSQFLAEFLHKALRTGGQDIAIFNFLEDSIHQFDTLENSLNFHLHFLAKLMPFVGIMPDFTAFSDDSVLDITEGRMVMFSSGDFLEHNLCQRLMQIYETPNAHLTSADRRDLIDFFAKYYQRHLAGFGNLKTLDIFRTMV